MREIKFRAWNGINLIDLKKVTPLTVHADFNLDGLFIPFHKDYVLMQYTGLKDKNGKEIYEGDIIDCGSYHGKKQVVHSNGSYKVKGKLGQLVGFGSWAKTTEVIGNIYENPELLKP